MRRSALFPGAHVVNSHGVALAIHHMLGAPLTCCAIQKTMQNSKKLLETLHNLWCNVSHVERAGVLTHSQSPELRKSTMKKLTDATLKLITAACDSNLKARGKMDLAIDGLVAEGIKADDLFAPEKGKDRALYESMLEAVEAGMPASARSLLRAETQNLPESSKIKKRYWQQQRGSLLKDVRRALGRRETTASGARQSMTLEASALKALDALKERFQKAEKPTADVTKVLAAIATLAKLLK